MTGERKDVIVSCAKLFGNNKGNGLSFSSMFSGWIGGNELPMKELLVDPLLPTLFTF